MIESSLPTVNVHFTQQNLILCCNWDRIFVYHEFFSTFQVVARSYATLNGVKFGRCDRKLVDIILKRHLYVLSSCKNPQQKRNRFEVMRSSKVNLKGQLLVRFFPSVKFICQFPNISLRGINVLQCIRFRIREESHNSALGFAFVDRNPMPRNDDFI